MSDTKITHGRIRRDGITHELIAHGGIAHGGITHGKITHDWGIRVATFAAKSSKAMAAALLLSGCLLGSWTARAQYRDYPRAEGPAQTLGSGDLGKWTVDGEVRGRTEDQTAINYIPGHTAVRLKVEQNQLVESGL